MNAAPFVPTAETFRDSDVMALVGSLCSLLEHVPARVVTLVIFNLEQQTVLYRDDGFTTVDIDDATKVIREQYFGSINYTVLRQPNGGEDLLRGLTRDVFSKSAPSDALVFLGPHARVHDAIRTDAVKSVQVGPRVFYVLHQPQLSWLRLYDQTWSAANDVRIHNGQAVESLTPEMALIVLPDDEPDTIERFVRRLKGEILEVRQPSDLLRAIKHIAPTPSRQNPDGHGGNGRPEGNPATTGKPRR
jgi:hypothetical protein